MPASVLVTIIGSLILIVMGGGSYAISESKHITALIPSIMGAVLLVCGLAAIKPANLKVAMHVATPIALLGAIGSTRIFSKLSDPDVTALAKSTQVIAFVIFTVMFATYIASFIKARKQRKLETEASPA